MGLTLATAACAADDDQPKEPAGGGPRDGASQGDAVKTNAKGGDDVVDPSKWRIESEQEDPLAVHREGRVLCSPFDLIEENGGLEINTRRCSYVSLIQESLVELAEGDTLELTLWWARLASIEPAQAHLALLLDDSTVWEELVPIPGDADTRSISINLDEPLAEQPTVRFHLHNHGYNTWNLNALVRR